MKAKWTSDDVPGQHGRLAVVTGADTGLGFETAQVLAARGASVVLAVRDTEKGKRAAARIACAAPGADVTVQPLDLASLDSIRAAAGQLRAQHPAIDLLINNAGVMFTPKQATGDGFELQFGTNHLGHFALTGLLLEQMLPVPGSRVVTVTSIAHRIGARINFDDLQGRAVLPPGRRLQPVQAGEPDVHLRAGPPAARRGHHHRGRRPPRPGRHRAGALHAPDHRVLLHAGEPEAGDGRTAHPARRHRPRRAPAASTTAQADSSGPGATRNWPTPAADPTTPPPSAACGQSPNS